MSEKLEDSEIEVSEAEIDFTTAQKYLCFKKDPALKTEKVLGKTLKRDIAKNTQLKWSDLE